eukprot:904410-Prymnesium_polylepis.1
MAMWMLNQRGLREAPASRVRVLESADAVVFACGLWCALLHNRRAAADGCMLHVATASATRLPLRLIIRTGRV